MNLELKNDLKKLNNAELKKKYGFLNQDISKLRKKYKIFKVGRPNLKISEKIKLLEDNL